MTDTNRWEMLSKEEKLEVLEVPFGWMLRKDKDGEEDRNYEEF